MSVFTDLLMVAFVTVYIVDLSGFTDSWRGAISRWLNIKSLRPLKPFDCSLCMTWWVCLVYAWVNWGMSIQIVAYCALLSFLSIPIGNAMIFIKEWLLWIIDKLMPGWKM